MALEPTEDFTRIESIFVRQRNVLMIRGHFPGIYTDYYLHLMQHGLETPESLDTSMKELLTMLTLHLTARPWAETIAWTLNLRAPRVNFFATGGSIAEQITGRCFTEDVREPDRNFLYSQTITKGKEPQNSTIEVEGTDPLVWVEMLYRQSEQRPCRTFRLPDENYVLIAAQPDFDMEWFEALDDEQVLKMEHLEETRVLETRQFRFHCGCSIEKILPALGAWRDRPETLFRGEEKIVVQCPRCAAKYIVTQDML